MQPEGRRLRSAVAGPVEADQRTLSALGLGVLHPWRPYSRTISCMGLTSEVTLGTMPFTVG